MQHDTNLSAASGALQEAAEHVRTARTLITNDSKRLADEILTLGGNWSGEGFRAFTSVHTAWQEKSERVVRALDDFAESLVDTDRDNTATDTARAEVSARLLSRLG